MVSLTPPQDYRMGSGGNILSNFGINVHGIRIKHDEETNSGLARIPARRIHGRENSPSNIASDDIVTLSYHPVHRDPLTAKNEGGITLTKIAPKARVY
ncbi:MAG: hypothetical protein KDJ78_12340 [Rhodobacteraceae bacterium]|uniref:hypothetical protein n=1 Tax=Amaricoccus sp. TaxID=1872485 RepID=UPI001DE9DEC8|nr:hypothetical protein [Amaricoccus sp.]MCB1374941.1 hypothetical protein [Paracoccaceae bacterium]MCB1404533.1 hypothetical protein [Paracoccaceae bacterium]MCC0067541.1 hypothetical protein [Rhodovulum sp.]HRW17003.1 hypothetical protein [Amaricoccus sp.]